MGQSKKDLRNAQKKKDKDAGILTRDPRVAEKADKQSNKASCTICMQEYVVTAKMADARVHVDSKVLGGLRRRRMYENPFSRGLVFAQLSCDSVYGNHPNTAPRDRQHEASWMKFHGPGWLGWSRSAGTGVLRNIMNKRHVRNRSFRCHAQPNLQLNPPENRPEKGLKSCRKLCA